MKKHPNSVWNLMNELNSKQGITEVIINSPEKIFIEKGGRFFFLNVKLTKEDIAEFCQDLASLNRKKLDIENPILNGNMEDGSRINIVLEPFSHGCPAVTIRKYLKHITSFDNDTSIFGLDDKWVHFIRVLIQARCNLVVSGGTGVGKTTFLNLLLQEIPQTQRVITIEDTKELSANLLNWVSLETSAGNSLHQTIITIRDLVKNSLRMRPDRIVIGEVRGDEIFDLLQAMNTGHDGSFTTIHANAPAECTSRIENLFLMAGYEMPVKVVREQISSALDFIIQLGRDRDGKRVVTHFTEISNMEGDKILLQDIGKHVNGSLMATGLVPKRMGDLIKFGLEKDFFL